MLIVNPRGRPPRQLEWGDGTTADSVKSGAGFVDVVFDWHLPHVGSTAPTYGRQSGGRWIIRVFRGALMKGFKWWLSDPVDNSVNSQNLNNAEDEYTASVPREVVLSDTDVVYEFYVSATDYESRNLHIQGYAEVTGASLSGTPATTLTIPLELEGQVSVQVQNRSPEGHSSSRWRHLDFSASPEDFRYTWDTVFEVTSSTSFRPWGVIDQAGKFKLGYGEDVWVCRTRYNDPPENDEDSAYIPQGQYSGMQQFRRVVSVTTDADINNPVVYHYDRPFDPPLAVDDEILWIDRCVMVRVVTGGMNPRDDLPTMFRPTLGEVFIDMWALYPHLDGSSAAFYTEESWADRIYVEYYLHNAGHIDTGDQNDDILTPIIFPRGRVQRVSLRCDQPPRFRRAIAEAADESTDAFRILRVQVDQPAGRVDRWRLYLKSNDAPVIGSGGDIAGSLLDPDYLVGEFTRAQQVVYVPLGAIDASLTWNVVVEARTADEEPGARYFTSYAFGDVGAELFPVRQIGTQGEPFFVTDDPIFVDNLRVDVSDSGSGPIRQCNNVVRWDVKGDASVEQATLEIWREDWGGSTHNEKRVLVTTVSLNDGVYTHAWNLAGAMIGDRASGSTPQDQPVNGWRYYPLAINRRLTWCYALTYYDADGKLARLVGRRSDWYTDSAEIETQAITANVYAPGVVDANGLQTEPLTVLLHAKVANQDEYQGTATANVDLILEYNLGAGYLVIQRVSAASCHGFEFLHQWWGKQQVDGEGGDLSITYRLSSGRQISPFERLDPVTTTIVIPNVVNVDAPYL